MSKLILRAHEVGAVAWKNNIKFNYHMPFGDDLKFDVRSVYLVCPLQSLSPVGAFVLAAFRVKHERESIEEMDWRFVKNSMLYTETMNDREFHLAVAFYAAVVKTLFGPRIPIPARYRESAQRGLSYVIEEALSMSPVLSVESHLALFHVAHSFANFFHKLEDVEQEHDLSNHVCLAVFLELCEELHIEVSEDGAAL